VDLRILVVDDVGDAVEERAEFPWPLIDKMPALGIVTDGILGYGCRPMSPIAKGLIHMELNRGDGSLGTFVAPFPQRSHGGLQPTQLEVVWRLPPQGDAEGPQPSSSPQHRYQRNAKPQLTVWLSPPEAVPGVYIHPDHRRRLRRPAVRSDLDV
jgi:hypothetical protein